MQILLDLRLATIRTHFSFSKNNSSNIPLLVATYLYLSENSYQNKGHTMDRNCNGMRALDLSWKANFLRILWVPQNRLGLSSQGPDVMWLCYLTWNLELPRLPWLNHCLACSSFQCIFQYRHEKSVQTFKFCNGTPTSITDVTKILSHFLLSNYNLIIIYNHRL